MVPTYTDQIIRLYDCQYGRFHKFKSIKARDVGWSVLDVAFTPDGNHFLYSSWSDYSEYALDFHCLSSLGPKVSSVPELHTFSWKDHSQSLTS